MSNWIDKPGATAQLAAAALSMMASRGQAHVSTEPVDGVRYTEARTGRDDQRCIAFWLPLDAREWSAMRWLEHTARYADAFWREIDALPGWEDWRTRCTDLLLPSAGVHAGFAAVHGCAVRLIINFEALVPQPSEAPSQAGRVYDVGIDGFTDGQVGIAFRLDVRVKLPGPR